MSKARGALILTDLEGISGVYTIDAIPFENDLYRDACERLMGDTNTAVSALFDSGADEVFVLDGHCMGTNFIDGALDKRAKQVSIPELSDIMSRVSSVVLIGMHAMAGTINAFLDHTQNSAKIHRYFYNGKKIGEMSQAGFFAGLYGVPVIAVSGDEAAMREAAGIFPDTPRAAVKKALKRNEALCLPTDEAHARIYEAVKRGFALRESIAPMEATLPLTVEVEFNRCDYADDAVANNPTLERVDEYVVRSVKTEVNGYLDVLILY